VLAGNALYQCGCVQYPTSDIDLLIIALCVGIGLALIIIIVVAIAWCIRRKKPSESDRGNSLNNTEQQDRRVNGFEDEHCDREENISHLEDTHYSRRLPDASSFRN